MKEPPNPTIVGYPVIMFGTDASVFDPTSDTALRMKTYEAFYSHIYIITSACDKAGRDMVALTQKTTVYSSRGGNKLRVLWGMYRIAQRVMREHGVRCIMSQDPFMLGFISYLLTRGGRGVFGVGIYGTDTSNRFFCTESFKHRVYALVARYVLPRATAIQTDGPETVDRLTAAYGAKVFFKPMIPANIDVLGTRERVPSSVPLRVLFMGRFVAQKNIPLLLDVIEVTKKQLSDKVRFTLVGSGAEHNWFTSEIMRRGLAAVCDIKGSVSREAVADVVMNNDVLLIVSRYEGFPRVFMEAAVSGMTVVTTDVGGIKDLIIDGESGFVVPQGSTANDIVQRIRTLAEDCGRLALFSHAIRRAWGERYGGKSVLDYQKPLVEFLGEHVTALSTLVRNG